MDIAMIGLGKMGLNMTSRLVKGGHRVLGNARTVESIHKGEAVGAEGLYALENLATALKAPRVVWVMVPSGKITDDTLEKVSQILSPGDIIIDGGNSNYKDTQRHAKELTAKGFQFVDVGTSGGIWGITEGYSLMIGGEKASVEYLRPIFETLAPGKSEGWGHVGTHGAGHFVKMIHNGIEYGMMQALAEGFEIMKKKEEYGFDLSQIAQVWRTGSVVRSWLLDLTANVLEQDAELSDIRPWVPDSGEGRWTVAEAMDLDVPAPVITLALQARFVSRDAENYSARLLAGMRNQFGGHAIKHQGEES